MNNFNDILLKGSRGFVFGYAIGGTLFLLINSLPIVQGLFGLALGIAGWDWYKKRTKK